MFNDSTIAFHFEPVVPPVERGPDTVDGDCDGSCGSGGAPCDGDCAG